MPGTLYVVATPIGNLEDVTLRALRVLREVSLIAAEDTRRTTKLLQHYSISTPTTSVHEHNERRRSASILARLQAGESVALVTDAGTPVVSDPGADLVTAAHAAHIKVEPVPGPSAALAALSASGFAGDQFLFAGFPPSRSNARKQWLENLRDEPRTLILYEAPHRIRQTLEDMLTIWGDRPVALGRELTKAHEELVVRPISQHISLSVEARGEYTLVIAANSPKNRPSVPPSNEQLTREFGELTNVAAIPHRSAVKELARKYNLPTRTIYSVVHRLR